MTKKHIKKGVLCNQGCGTRLFFKDKRPYNMLDKEKHVCPMLEMAKFWGGYYNTIPMGKIFSTIAMAYEDCKAANESRNIDEILKALPMIVRRLADAIEVMGKQEDQNNEWAGKLESYKKKLVDDQRRREEEENQNKGHEWVQGDELN